MFVLIDYYREIVPWVVELWMDAEPFDTILWFIVLEQAFGHWSNRHSNELTRHFALTVDKHLFVFVRVIQKIIRVYFSKDHHIAGYNMVILPLKLNLAVISSVTKL